MSDETLVERVRHIFGPDVGHATAFRDVVVVRERGRFMRWLTGERYKVETVPFLVLGKFSVATLDREQAAEEET